MRINLLISTIFPRLCERALLTAANHGADCDFVPVIVGPDRPRSPGIRFCEQAERRGSNAANRFGLQQCDDDAIIVLAADDIVFTRGWLAQCLPRFLEAEQQDAPFVMGIRHAGNIGTAYGRMYANFPMFRKSMLARFPRVAEGFCPPWLVGQWGDVAFGMAVWREGGKVVDSGTDVLIRWSDRMGCPESPLKTNPAGADMTAFQDHFVDMGEGWPRSFRGFNVDCPPRILREGTVCEPMYADFVERYSACR